jgi:hypothetical protein
MPSTSKKQHNFMAAIAHSPSFAKKVGVPQSVGQDFNKADKGHKFKEGGNTMATKKSFPASLFKGKESMSEELKEAKAIKSGKITPMQYAKGEKSEPAMKRGGGVKKMAAGGLAAGHKSADGIATKGKTKGTQVTMKRGGKC